MEKSTIQEFQEQFAEAVACKKDCSQILKLIVPGGILESPADAIHVYERGYNATLTEALGETYEATWSVLGDDEFFALAKAYLSKYPSLSYNLSDYGEHMPTFLEESTWARNFPFLTDLAGFEWTFKAVFHKSASEKRLKNIPGIAPDSMLTFVPSVRLLKCKFSVYAIWQQRKDQDTCIPSEIYGPEHLLLYKGYDEKVWVVRLNHWQFDLLVNLYNGKPLEESLNATLSVHTVSEASLIQSFFADIASYSIIENVSCDR